QVQKVIELNDHGVATSGDYRNYFERDGLRYSHTIDPRTGYPISHRLASVTVVADDAAEADALATAYMVMGVEQALALARRDKVAAYFLVRNDTGFIEYSSDTFAEQFE
ncbi:MAG TPA: FAD:protein FMN transferase ApbE, partial [Porticoccaceae bacterium]|nr:FAD:protein FMN transferase ApbE [Porticoccaceae bacterium]